MPDFSRLTSLDLGQIFEVVQNPTSNLTAAALIGAAVIVLLLILVVIAWMFLLTTEDDSTKPKARPSAGSARRFRRTAPRRLPVWVPFAVLAIAVAGIAGFGYSTGRDAHCIECHTEAGPPEALESTHARCVKCHERSSLLLVLPNLAARLRMEASSLTGDEAARAGLDASVDNRTCLRCHTVRDLDEHARESAEASGSVRVVMSHREPVDAGMRCVECHGSVGAHKAVDAEGAHPTMRLCSDGHNGVNASTECDMCHIGDPVEAVRADPTPIAKTRLGKPTDCSGCHSVESCDACHGIRLPHSTAFIKGGHGYEAAFGKRRSACASCHEGTWCLDRCHQGGNWKDPNAMWGHPGDWRSRHAQFETKDCTSCHSKQFTCESCHPE